MSPVPTATKKPLAITPPKNGADNSKSSISVENLLPGQKIRVSVIEGRPLPSAKASTKPTPKAPINVKATPKPSVSGSKSSAKAPLKVVPKPSGSSAGIGINNLKPGQKIKVTIKTGGTKK